MARGDRVLLYMQNCPQFIIAYYAILRADAVVVPVNPMNRTEELRHYVEDSDAAVAIVGQDVFKHIEPLQGLKHVLVAAYSDYLGEKPICRCRISCARRARLVRSPVLEGGAGRGPAARTRTKRGPTTSR